jgi:hypothetical protein
LPDEVAPPGWDDVGHPDPTGLPAALPFDPRDDPRVASPRRRRPAAPPCAALKAILWHFNLRQRASSGTRLLAFEQDLLRRIETALRQADVRSRRVWKRHAVRRPVNLGARDLGHVEDVSAGGMRIGGLATMPRPGTLTEVSMRMTMPAGERTVVFPCRVAWVNYRDKTIGVAFGASARWD